MSEKSERLIRVAGVIEKMELNTVAAMMREIAEEHAELLAALEEVFVIGDRLVSDVYGYEFVEKARAAIARATGETQ